MLIKRIRRGPLPCFTPAFRLLPTNNSRDSCKFWFSFLLSFSCFIGCYSSLLFFACLKINFPFLEFIALRYYFRNSRMHCHDRSDTFDSTVRRRSGEMIIRPKTKLVIIKASSCYRKKRGDDNRCAN